MIERRHGIDVAPIFDAQLLEKLNHLFLRKLRISSKAHVLDKVSQPALLIGLVQRSR